ncbi:MAG: CPBP family intramembrane glutamic endopeptidase [Phycisphaeraceae bacterium]
MIRKHPLIWFFVITFAITWSVALTAWLLHVLNVFQLPAPSPGEGHLQGLSRTPGPTEDVDVNVGIGGYVLLILGVWAPTLTSIGLSWHLGGWDQLKRLLRRLLRWRAGWIWWLLAIFGPLVVQILAMVMVKPFETVDLGRWGPDSVTAFFVFLGAGMADGPLGEELGWRGFALPRMIRHMSGRVAAVVLGVIWAAWHLPAFFVPGVERIALPPGFGYEPFFLLLVSACVLISWVYLGGRQVLPLAIVMHFTMNFALLTVGRDPQPTLIWAMTAAAGLSAVLVLIFTPDLGRQRALESDPDLGRTLDERENSS